MKEQIAGVIENKVHRLKTDTRRFITTYYHSIYNLGGNKKGLSNLIEEYAFTKTNQEANKSEVCKNFDKLWRELKISKTKKYWTNYFENGDSGKKNK